jgi:hypothetical protein
MWTRLIAEGQAGGQFAACGDPKMVAFGILGMCNWLARWYDPKKSIGITELIDTYFGMIAYGLVQPELRGKRPGAAAERRAPPPAKRSAAKKSPRNVVALRRRPPP